MSSPDQQLPPALLGLIDATAAKTRMPKGTTIVVEGDHADSMFILTSGRAKVFTQDERGREVIYRTLGAGDVFGEMMLDGGLRSASVKATTEIECIEVCRSDLKRLLQDDPGLAEFLVLTLIERLRTSTEKIRSLALESVLSRTIAAIEELAICTDGVRHLPSTVTQRNLASRIGATREMVNHVFRDLLKSGQLIRDDKLGFVIPEPLRIKLPRAARR